MRRRSFATRMARRREAGIRNTCETGSSNYGSSRYRLAVVGERANTELEAARAKLQELYRELATARPFSWSRMGSQMEIARLKRRIAQLEREGKDSGADV